MLNALLVGAALAGANVAIHAIGSTFWLHVLASYFPGTEQHWRIRTAMMALTSTAIFLLALHIAEVFLWAVTYIVLPGLTKLTTFEEAAYFSAVTFTTLGYGDISLDPPWRVLSGVEAMAGILLFGWTTAMMFSVIQKVAHAVRNRSGSSTAHAAP